jgi:hypothetical protein
VVASKSHPKKRRIQRPFRRPHQEQGKASIGLSRRATQVRQGIRHMERIWK